MSKIDNDELLNMSFDNDFAAIDDGVSLPDEAVNLTDLSDPDMPDFIQNPSSMRSSVPSSVDKPQMGTAANKMVLESLRNFLGGETADIGYDLEQPVNRSRSTSRSRQVTNINDLVDQFKTLIIESGDSLDLAEVRDAIDDMSDILDIAQARQTRRMKRQQSNPRNNIMNQRSSTNKYLNGAREYLDRSRRMSSYDEIDDEDLY